MLSKNYKIILSSCIATIFEWYDYTLSIHFAVTIANNFFPKANQSATLLEALLVFAVGYLVRPIGGIFFGIIGDKFGRKEAVAMSVICISLPTTIIGILPTYQSIGVSATIIITITRLLQGLSVGGNLTGSVSFLIENSNKKNHGLLGSLLMFSLCIGIFLGLLTSYLMKANLTSEQFNNWGWRIPFLLGSPIILLGIYIKYAIQDTPIFKQMQTTNKIEKSPFRKTLRSHWRDILISIMINSTGSVIFYFEAAYLIHYLEFSKGFDKTEIDYLNKFCCIIMAVVTLLSGWLYDRIGAKKLYTTIIISVILSIGFITQLLEQGNFNVAIFAQIAVAILAALYIGAEPAMQSALYCSNIRNTALSLSYNISVSIFGGTAPIIFEYLVQTTGSLHSVAYYIASCSVISLIGIYLYKKKANYLD
ncbi:sugar (and other) transporter family protein [Orientia chuto str. Dubai]|uniref:Sugar (And other) transporter family protein n=1 Tax=Orientia chuto str. Dubai TaxID=1359168 RepID=A0A0F3MPV6_9RICK|nr:MFS transporter [Candidatus Orientia mediorientalis]KJV57497.1 sugar (and other) transporter family protein [Orientia chuto str. Dubai]